MLPSLYIQAISTKKKLITKQYVFACQHSTDLCLLDKWYFPILFSHLVFFFSPCISYYHYNWALCCAPFMLAKQMIIILIKTSVYFHTPSILEKNIILDSDTVSKVYLWLLIFIKIFIAKWYIYILWKYFSRQIYSYNFCILKLNNLKIIHDLCSQYLTQTLFKTTFFSSMEGVCTMYWHF